MVYLSLLVFLDNGFRFQKTVCNGCHDESMLSFDIDSFFFMTIHDVDYRFVIFRNRKNFDLKIQ